MEALEVKLRRGMTENGIAAATQENLIESIRSFALYGFPESHAASFALIAYASAYLKVRYLAAFTCAMLNNQPMGFYSPAVLVNDARRHGLRIRPVDVQVSEWPCTIEHEPESPFSLRLGLMYAKGLQKSLGEAIVESRRRDGPFRSAEDLALRMPLLKRKELTLLARIGALNCLGGIDHRRDALWQVEEAGRPAGPLLRPGATEISPHAGTSPLRQMTRAERLGADYSGTGLTLGRHPMCDCRRELEEKNVLAARELRHCKDGQFVRAAGCIIARQRPGTAKGFIFLSVEDETGILNVIITPDLYERERVVVTRSKFVLVEGPLQNQDGVIHIKAKRIHPLAMSELAVRSHDFH
jgi:error-prone DNA polymerase